MPCPSLSQYQLDARVTQATWHLCFTQPPQLNKVQQHQIMGIEYTWYLFAIFKKRMGVDGGGGNLWFPVCFPAHQSPSEKDVPQRALDVYTTSPQRRWHVMTLRRRCINVMCSLGPKRTQFDLIDSKVFFYRNPLFRRDKNNFDKVAFPEIVSKPLNKRDTHRENGYAAPKPVCAAA